MTPTARAVLAKTLYAEAMSPAPGMALLGRDESSARAALSKFVADTQEGKMDGPNSLVVAQLLERALKVDMTIPANRKGDIPAALNLVSRVDSQADALHRTVYLMMDDLLHRSDKSNKLPTKKKCAGQVVDAFFEAKLPTLQELQVLKIYDRWAEEGPAPHGPKPSKTRR